MLQRVRIGPRILIVIILLLVLLIAASGVILWQSATIFSEAYGLVIELSPGETAVETETTLLATYRRVLIASYASIFAIILLACLLGYFLSKTILRDVSALKESAERWSAGELDHRAALDGYDELSDLARLLNRTVDRQQKWSESLETSIAKRATAIEHRAHHLETSVAIAQRITSILEPDILLQQVTDIIRQRYDLTYVALFLATRDGRSLILEASTRPEDTQLSLKLPIEEHTLIGWVAHHRRPGLANNLLEQPPSPPSADRPQTNSELALPLTLGRDLLGVLDLKSDRPTNFSREDLPMFQSLADQVAIAIKNASIYETEQSQRELAEILQEVGAALNSTLNLEDVLQLVLQQAFKVVEYEKGAILLWDGRQLEFTVSRQLGEIYHQPLPPIPLEDPLSSGILGRIIFDRQYRLVNELQVEERWVNHPGLPDRGSWLGIPLVHEETVSGILFLSRAQSYAFTEQEISLTTAMAAQASIALENARLYDQITRFNQELEEIVRQRTLDLQAAYQQLTQLDQAKSNFIAVASHELRTPLTIIKSYSQILSKDRGISENEGQSAAVEKILAAINRLQAIVDTMVSMATIDDDTIKLEPEPLSLFTLVRDLKSELETALEERNLTVSLTPAFRRLPTIAADKEALASVLRELLFNAVKYTPDGGNITIDGRAWETPPPHREWPAPGLEISVRDSGIGIPPEKLETIFNKFYQTGPVDLHSSSKTKFKGGGPGLGLAIVRGLVRAHGGVVWADSRGEDEESLPGSTFHVVLPIHRPDEPSG